MTIVAFHHDGKRLPQATDDLLPVQVYGLNGVSRGDISVIGSPVIDKIKRLGVPVSPIVMDFLTIALAVTAADTFVKREAAADGWTREILLRVPLAKPDLWANTRQKLEIALRFLSGDIWRLELTEGGYEPPEPYTRKYGRRLIKLDNLDCISLFSGGLDSTIGVIDLLQSARKPLLVSHSYKGDKTRQNTIAAHLRGCFSRFPINAHPRSFNRRTEISMRTRSMNFLAFAVVGSNAVQTVNQLSTVEVFVPENGFISLNAPLTPRRLGSLSTRTTHPYFISLIQEIFQDVGIDATIINPYQFHTKGEMVLSCKNQALLEGVFAYTVSCSHWKRRNQQCGSCVPCLIRRAALKRGSLQETSLYRFNDLSAVLSNVDGRDDLFALSAAISQIKMRSIGPWILDSGPLPPQDIDRFKSVFIRGLNEVAVFLKSEGVL